MHAVNAATQKSQTNRQTTNYYNPLAPRGGLGLTSNICHSTLSIGCLVWSTPPACSCYFLQNGRLVDREWALASIGHITCKLGQLYDMTTDCVCGERFDNCAPMESLSHNVLIRHTGKKETHQIGAI